HDLVTVLSLPTPPKCFAASVLATLHAAFARKVEARPSGLSFRGHNGFTCVTARRLAHHPFQMASSIGFRIFSCLPSCYTSYGAWTFTPVGLAPTDHASLRWTHTSRDRSVICLLAVSLPRPYVRKWLAPFQGAG